MPKLSRFFYKQCLNKSTSQQEFSLIKKGELDFNCDDCVKSRLGLNHVKTPVLKHVQEPQDSFVDTEGKANKEQNKCGEYVGSNSSVSTQTDSSKCLKCEHLEAEKIELVCKMDKIPKGPIPSRVAKAGPVGFRPKGHKLNRPRA